MRCVLQGLKRDQAELISFAFKQREGRLEFKNFKKILMRHAFKLNRPTGIFGRLHISEGIGCSTDAPNSTVGSVDLSEQATFRSSVQNSCTTRY